MLQTELNGMLLPDTEISNNGDARKVLSATVAIIDYFFIHHTKATLHIAGSTLQRTRIYTIAYLLQNLRQEQTSY